MENLSIGTIKKHIFTKTMTSLLNEGESINDKTSLFNKFMDLYESTNTLQIETTILEKIKSANILEESLKMVFINNIVNLFEGISKEVYIEEHEKLNNFINENNIKFDEPCLVSESVSTIISNHYNKNVSPDKLVESYKFISEALSHVVNEGIEMDEGIEMNETIIKIAINKFNEKYKELNEADMALVKRVVLSDLNEQEVFFNEFKNENIKLLEEIEGNELDDKINGTITKINEMKFDSNNFHDSLYGLIGLNKKIKSMLD